MVRVTADNDHFVFDIVGLHKLWSFKDQIRIPREHIARAHKNIGSLPLWKGLRMPGIHVPFLITAGTYYKRGGKNFWDVVRKRNAIVVELKNDKYKRLIIEVENPDETLSLLNSSQPMPSSRKTAIASHEQEKQTEK